MSRQPEPPSFCGHSEHLTWEKGSAPFLGKETHWRGEDSVLGLRQCGFVVPTPALSLTSTSVTLDLGHCLWTVRWLLALRPRMAMGVNSANRARA